MSTGSPPSPDPLTRAARRSRVVELLREVLSRPRSLTSQILQHLMTHHEVEGDGVASWLRTELATLESYETDLLLSPLFTPSPAERLEFEEALGCGALDIPEVKEVALALDERAIVAQILHGGERIEVILDAVVVSRYVRLLHLDAALPEGIAEFSPLPPSVRCHLRDRAWRRLDPSLVRALLGADRRVGGDMQDGVGFLTGFLRTQRPRSLKQCLTALDNLAEAYERDLREHASGARPFFAGEIRQNYAGRWPVPQTVLTEQKRLAEHARALRAALEDSDARQQPGG